jgi:hypothetical protein
VMASQDKENAPALQGQKSMTKERRISLRWGERYFSRPAIVYSG